jgi:hypothetical protein
MPGFDTLGDLPEDATRATARLPGLDVEIVHRVSPEGDAERISIHLQATPSIEAFARHVEAMNPFAVWVQAARLAWLPWIAAAQLMLPPAPELPKQAHESPSIAPHEGEQA